MTQSQSPISHHQTCTIIDGMAAVQSLRNTTGAKSFGEWSDNFTAFVVSHFSDKCIRVDVVFDRYLPNSIKGVTKAMWKRGKSKGIRRDVESKKQRIRNWDSLLLSLKKTRPVLPIFCRLKCRNVMGRILEVS